MRYEDFAADYLDGMTYRQIAKKYNTTRNAISGAVFRARARGEVPDVTTGHTPMQQQARKPRATVTEKRPEPATVGITLARGVAESVAACFAASVDNPKSNEGLTIVDLEACQCRYPIKTVGRTHYFCGAPTLGVKSSFCAQHRAAVFYIKEKRNGKDRSLGTVRNRNFTRPKV